MDNYYEQLKVMIKQSSFTQKDLAKSVGVSENHLNGMLSGRYVITDSMEQRLKYHYEKLSNT